MTATDQTHLFENHPLGKLFSEINGGKRWAVTTNFNAGTTSYMVRTQDIIVDPYQRTFTQFHLSSFPGCCGIVIIHNIFWDKLSFFDGRTGSAQYQTQLQFLDLLVQWIKTNFSVGLVLYSQIENRAQFQNHLNELGWEIYQKFVNRSTDRTIVLYGRVIK